MDPRVYEMGEAILRHQNNDMIKAVEANDTARLEALLRDGFVDKPDPLGTPLAVACQRGHVRCARVRRHVHSCPSLNKGEQTKNEAFGGGQGRSGVAHFGGMDTSGPGCVDGTRRLRAGKRGEAVLFVLFFL